MNQANSNWTGRTPRNLNQAFGPYAHIGGIHEQVETHPHDRIVTWACGVALVAFVCIMFVWG